MKHAPLAEALQLSEPFQAYLPQGRTPTAMAPTVEVAGGQVLGGLARSPRSQWNPIARYLEPYTTRAISYALLN